MAIGTITINGGDGAKPSTPLYADLISFAGDGAYPSGGTAGFEALFRTKVAQRRTIIAVLGQDCGGYVPVYDRANDKLLVYYGNNDGASDGPLVENATADLSAVTFNVLVVSS